MGELRRIDSRHRWCTRRVAVVRRELASISRAQWLGPASEANVPAAWTEDDYRWTAPLPGVGHSSPVVWEDRLFVTSADEETGRRFAICLNATNGKQIWRREFAGTAYEKHALNKLASSTPAVDARHLYCCFTGPESSPLIALDREGNEVWRRELGPFVSGHGGGVSPIVDGDLVIVACEHQGGGSLLALDCASGDERWRIPRESNLHYATPCRLDRENGRGELIFTNWEQGFTAVDPAEGSVLWQSDLFDKRHIESSIASPIVSGKTIIGTCGWLAVRQESIALSPPNGESPAKRLFTIDRSAPLCVTPLAKNGLLFLWADEGIVTCASLDDGQVLWRRRVGGQYYCSPVCIGDRLYNISTEGDAICLAASKEFALLGKSKIDDPSHAVPAIANGMMFVRTMSSVIAIGGQ
jgi:outer membrane protein assembly factor BamB